MLPANNIETPRATPIATPTKKRVTVNICLNPSTNLYLPVLLSLKVRWVHPMASPFNDPPASDLPPEDDTRDIEARQTLALR